MALLLFVLTIIVVILSSYAIGFISGYDEGQKRGRQVSYRKMGEEDD